MTKILSKTVMDDKNEGDSSWEEMIVKDSLLPKFGVIPLAPVQTNAILMKSGKLSAFFENRQCISQPGTLCFAVVLAVSDAPIGCVFFTLAEREAVSNFFAELLLISLEKTWATFEGKRPSRLQVLKFFRTTFAECSLIHLGVSVSESLQKKERELQLYHEAIVSHAA